MKRLGKWTTCVDETVMMGGAPFGFAGLPESLHEKHGVSNYSMFFFRFEWEIVSPRRTNVRFVESSTCAKNIEGLQRNTVN